LIDLVRQFIKAGADKTPCCAICLIAYRFNAVRAVQAYLMYWSCTVTNTFRVVTDFEWFDRGADTLAKECTSSFSNKACHPQRRFTEAQSNRFQAPHQGRVKRISKHMLQSKSILNHDSSVANRFGD